MDLFKNGVRKLTEDEKFASTARRLAELYPELVISRKEEKECPKQP
jgi:hypothetical protein